MNHYHLFVITHFSNILQYFYFLQLNPPFSYFILKSKMFSLIHEFNILSLLGVQGSPCRTKSGELSLNSNHVS